MNAQRKNHLKGVLLGTALGVALQRGGYLLVHGARTYFDWAMFVVVPFVSGLAVASVVRRARRILACCRAQNKRKGPATCG
jgi:hypothetical protein